MGPGLIILIVLILIVIIPPIVIYNGLVALRNHCRESWSDIDTELKRRYELIPNLVATVKGYAAHEKDLLEEVTRLREQCAMNNGSPAQQASTENLLSSALGRLMVRVEQYPDLKANENFLELQRELTNTENRIQAARRFFNGNVRDLNNRVEMFPSNIIASMFGFEREEYFKLDDPAEAANPQVSI